MPMHRWMQSAAGGTIQRLKPGLAMMRSRSSNPIPETGKSSVVSKVAIASSLQLLPSGVQARQPVDNERYGQDGGSARAQSIKWFRQLIEISNHAEQQS